MNINKANLKNFRSDFATAMKSLEEEYGVSVSMKNISFTEDKFTTKLEVTNLSESGEVVDSTVEDFKKQARFYGLKVSDLGRTFVSQGRTFKVCGLKPSYRKYPVLAKSNTGKTFKFAADTVVEGLEIASK